MLTLKRLSPGLLVALFFVACEPPKVEPELSLTGSPRMINALGQRTTIRALATDDTGKPGTGNVRFTSPAGSLKAGEEVALAAGEAEVEFSCEQATDPLCTGPVRITAEWVSGGVPLTATITITVNVVIPDAGLSLTASTDRLGLTLGDVSNIVATFQLDGVPQAGRPINLSTTNGVLLQPDGGAFSGMANTGADGTVRAVLTEAGMPGPAIVTATGPSNTGRSTTVTIYRPDAGLQLQPMPSAVKLSLNEPSTITITHSIDNRPFPGRQIEVTSSLGELRQLDGGAFVSPATTNAMGIIRALLVETGAVGTANIVATDPLLGTTAMLNVPIQLPDAGMSITADQATLKLTLNQRSAILFTQTLDGLPRANQPIALTTSAGRLLEIDGGAFVSPALTNASGEVRALLTEDPAMTPNNATVRAADQWGRSVTTAVRFAGPDAGLTVTSNPSLITLGFNQSSRITVQHLIEGQVSPGRPVTLETTAGALRAIDGGTFTSPAITDGLGRVYADLVDTGSTGVATLTARDTNWGGQATTNVLITNPDAGLTVAAGKSRIIIGVGDESRITARLTSNGVPAIGRNLQLTTSLGTLVQTDGGAFTNPGVTDSNGIVELNLRESGSPGTATITATDPMSSTSRTTTVAIDQVSTLTFRDMRCNGALCTVLGLANSGFNTTAVLTFELRDARNQAVPGVTVAFTINNAPSGTGVTTSSVTDSSGIAQAVVTTGTSIGSFSVTASVLSLQATSGSFGVVGAKPSNNGFTFSCTRTNLPVYVATMPPASIPTTCTVSLNDRNLNPIGTGTPVSFLAEAGSITSSTTTTPYSAAGTNQGRGTVNFQTTGAFPAVDVAPLPADPAAFPDPVEAEPFAGSGLFRNPRDGLVTIIAYVDGEEYFADSNTNGVRDPGEAFYDQGEPLVDSNDNDRWDVGENYIDVNQNNMWDGPNGVWEGNTKVWAKTAVLYTDVPSTISFSPASFDVARNATQFVLVTAGDRNLNRVEAGSALVFNRTASRGTVTISDNHLTVDGYGFVYQPMTLVGTSSATAPCNRMVEARCVFKTVIRGWEGARAAQLRLVGANDAMDLPMPLQDNITVTTTVRSVNVSGQLPGQWR